MHFSEMLVVNCGLLELHLGTMGLSDTGMERLCDGLQHNRSLRYLDLRWWVGGSLDPHLGSRLHIEYNRMSWLSLYTCTMRLKQLQIGLKTDKTVQKYSV